MAEGSELSPEQIAALQRRTSRPDNELPGAIPFHALVARTEDLAIALVAVDAYSTGLTMKMSIRLRSPGDDDLDIELFPHHGRHGEPGLLVGVEYPDGRTATNVSGHEYPDPRLLNDQPALWPHGGGGGGSEYEMEYWLTPMPTPGDLGIVTAWPARAIAESRIVVPAAAIATGVAANVELWPWQPPRERKWTPPPPPTLPPGGWFAEHADAPKGEA
jgi:hypothetical protein